MVVDVVEPPKKSYTFLFVTFFLIVLFAFMSAIGGIMIGKQLDARQRTTLVTRAQTSALAVNYTDLLALDGSPADLEKPEYARLKSLMIKLKNINPDIRFVYLMGLRNEKLFFFVDSEPPASPDYSAPGDVYEETSTNEVTNYKKSQTFVEGPYSDHWGQWITAESSIIDPNTGNTTAVLGMDVSTEVWRSEIVFARIMIAAAAALVTFFLLIIYLYLERSLSTLDSFKKTNKFLETEKSIMTESEEVAGLGRFTLLIGSGVMIWDPPMYTLFDLSTTERVSQELYLTYIDQLDRPRLIDTLVALSTGTQQRAIMEYSIHTAEKIKKVLTVMKAFSGPDGKITRIVGTTQDVTERTV